MPKPEEIITEPVKAEDPVQKALFEGAYIQRVADPGPQQPFIQIMPGANTGVVQDTPSLPVSVNSNKIVPLGQGTWRQVHSTGTWPTPAPATWPGPTDVQHNGRKVDLSRTPGTTVFQPRPVFEERQIRPQAVPQVAPGAIDATAPRLPQDATGRVVGPTVITGGDRQAPVLAPADPGRPGGLIDRNKDGKLEDERSEKDKGIASMRLLLMTGGFMAGMMKAGIKGAAVGALLGLVGAELTRPLNPFK